MSTSRRTFIAAATTAAIATTLSTEAGAATVTNYPKLVHHVFFWLKNPASKEDLAALLKGLATLKQIETVRGSHFGVPASTRQVPRGTVNQPTIGAPAARRHMLP